MSPAVDFNLVPQKLVQRVDVVTGGASAAYGSDAVAGVVNFILDTKFTGVKGSLNFSQTDRSDGRVVSGDLAYGTPFADGRSEEHTSELQSLMRISYAVFCLKKKKL